MLLDDLALFLQRLVDRSIRRMRLGVVPLRAGRRLLIVQIDGLPRAILHQALQAGRMPVLRRLLDRRGYRLRPMSVGLPSSTPSFQMSAMYGVHPDIPGFHYHDRRLGRDVYFPRAGDAALVEATQAGGRLGIVQGGSTYGCVFTGGAANSLFSFAMIKRPSGPGISRACAAFVVLGWVIVKCIVLTGVEVARALARLVADPVAERARGWRWLVIKLGLSVWMRQCFTLAVSRDLYRGVEAVYVNYLDYDVVAHAYGPRHRRALRALRRIDRSLGTLWRVLRRVPEHHYDLYVLSDHGQVACRPYASVAGGKALERVLLEDFLDPTGQPPADRGTSRGPRLASALRTLGSQRRHGLFQRFLNYLERDFLTRLGRVRDVDERGGVRIVVSGPNAFVYFVDEPEPVTIERIDACHPHLVEALSRSPGIGFVLARSSGEPVCSWRGTRYGLADLGDGPFAGRVDLDLVVQGIRDLMAMPSAGDLVLYGIGAPGGDVSFVPEVGAHAGPAAEEIQTFIIHPPDVTVPLPLVHPVQLYDHFVRYQAGSRRAT
jgi:type I phosphodiesterase/nucleotide pyrophosphatase